LRVFNRFIYCCVCVCAEFDPLYPVAPLTDNTCAACKGLYTGHEMSAHREVVLVPPYFISSKLLNGFGINLALDV